jgi:hypothetical protein
MVRHKACVDAAKAHGEHGKTKRVLETDCCSCRRALWIAHNANPIASRNNDTVDFDGEVSKIECVECKWSHRQALWTSGNVNRAACCHRCSIEFNAEVSKVEQAEKDPRIDWFANALMARPTDVALLTKCASTKLATQRLFETDSCTDGLPWTCHDGKASYGMPSGVSCEASDC